MSEPVRFTAVTTLFAINDPKSLPALVAVIESDESRRIQNRIAQGLVDRAWAVPSDSSETLKKALPPGFRLVGDKIQKG
jgi:HEAT repeat protein